MNNRKLQIIIGLLVTILAVTSILVCFASAFGADSAGYADTRGNVFQIMFGYQGKNAIPMLITAFVFQCVAVLFALFGALLPGRMGGMVLGLASLLLVAGGVIFLFAPMLYQSANASTIVPVEGETISNGSGILLTSIFSIVAGVIGIYGGYRSFKA